MKNCFKLILSFVVSIIMLLMTVTASAVEVNGNEAQLGQTVTYEIHASGCPSIIQAIDIEVTYDSTALEYIEDSIQMPNLRGTLVNDGDKDSIKFNALDLDGFSFYEDNIVASMQFRVISDHAPYLYIKSNVKNFIDDTLTEHGDEYIYYLTLSEDEIQQIETASQEIEEKKAENSPSEGSAASGAQPSASTQAESSSSGTDKEQSSTNSESKADDTDEALTSSQTAVNTADNPYGNNPHDDTVTASASKPANYSMLCFAAAGMLAVIAVTACVMLMISKRSGKDNKSENDK